MSKSQNQVEDVALSAFCGLRTCPERLTYVHLIDFYEYSQTKGRHFFEAD